MNKKSIIAAMLVASAWRCMFSMDFETRFEGIYWLREYYNEAIQKRDRGVIESHVPNFVNEPWVDYYNDAEETYWYEDMNVRRDRCYYKYSDLSKGYILCLMKRYFVVKSCKEIESNVYEIVLYVKQKVSEELYNELLSHGCDWTTLKDAVLDTTFYFQFDGDYLHIYLADRNTLFATYCAYDESEYQALVEAIKTNNFDNMVFTFPRHADGSCDYDESAWESAKKPGGGTSLRTGKATTVKENLRVHSVERTTSAVRITLAARTPVEILGIGGEETIDGITSKWVHVKVAPGTMGTDGTYIKWGNVVGWCFGGVVSDMEEVSESANASMSKTAEPAEEAAISKPAPAIGKTAVVTENLRLRTSDKTTAEVVTTLAAGTRVKVLAPGREDTIDGIASNWVQVEVLGGAQDKDGNAIEAGTVGWLFCGYLSEAESAESEMANEDVGAKQNATLPILPIAAGGAVLAVLLAVILFAVAKKRKASKK
ncbi:MAG: SH3 domain-containing protein [Treponema sp.]|nr:SH3 domain-containing protein [Treponema sp.]